MSVIKIDLKSKQFYELIIALFNLSLIQEIQEINLFLVKSYEVIKMFSVLIIDIYSYYDDEIYKEIAKTFIFASHC